MGLAVSDSLGITAQGLPTLERKNAKNDLERLRALAGEYDVKRIVVGHPISARGGETTMSQRAAAFAEKLRRKLRCPVELWDERLTSAEAGRMLRGAGISLEKRRRATDRVAAVLLLQNYLDASARQPQTGTDGEKP
jgi:putative pre-16S rRNA nuclease